MTFNKKYIVIAAIVLLLLISKKVSAAKIIAQFEGLELDAYKDNANIWTIGYGSTRNPYTGVIVKQGDKISKETAIDWLNKDIGQRQMALKKLIKVPVTANQLAALTSLAYNIGLGAFQKSTLLRLLNAKAPKIEVANQFIRWNKVNNVEIKGLTNRRILEKELFLQ
jgi:lysozyme